MIPPLNLKKVPVLEIAKDSNLEDVIDQLDTSKL
jgi:hypothetical protein